MQNETLFKMRVMEKLRKIPETWVVKVQQVAVRGTPDLIICHKGLFFAWELKVPRPGKKAKATPLQSHVLHKIKLANGCGWVVAPDDLDQHVDAMIRLGDLYSPFYEATP